MTGSAALLVDKVPPQALSAALGVVYRTIAAFQRHRAGCQREKADCGAVALIQRFGSALNLNVHFHMLVPDGVYRDTAGTPQFVRIEAPTAEQLQTLVQRISERVGRQLWWMSPWVIRPKAAAAPARSRPPAPAAHQ
jgi:hypothetical protein